MEATLKPGSATRPFPGIDAEIVNDKGEPAKAGYLVIKKPWPGMLRGIYRDPQRFQAQYWSRYPGLYFTGDGAKEDEDGYFWLLGRVDDVMNISGYRVSTMEVESALMDHPLVAEAAVIGRPHEIKGQAISAFVTLKEGAVMTKELADDLKEHVVKKIGAIARPDDILFTKGPVLFISDRQLLTFGNRKVDPFEAEYEKVLMEMAMSNQKEYLSAFRTDLEEQRYVFIVVDQLKYKLLGRGDTMGEENNAWVRRVMKPILCNYQLSVSYPEFNLAIYVPQEGERHCP